MDDLEDLYDGLRAFIHAEVEPRQAALLAANGGRERLYSEDGRLRPDVLRAMREIREASAAAGYYTMHVPEGLGGGGLGLESLVRTWEAIAHQCGPRSWLGYSAVAHWSRGPSHLLGELPSATQDRILPDLMAGRTTVCFGMSEPDAGSDAWRMRTRAVATEGGWSLSGSKQWVTNAPYADFAIIFAVSDPAQAEARNGGVGAFLVPTDAPGFSVDGVIEMFGHPGGDEGVVGLTDVTVPADHVLGDPGRGFELAMSGVSSGRLYNSARSIGLARWALEAAVDYGEQRVAFGRPIIENQGVSFPLAESVMEIHAAHLVALDCARKLDAGLDARNELAISKAYCTEAATRAVDRAMQAHGAMGFTNDVGLSEAWTQVRRLWVADGTAEMMRRQVMRGLRREAQIRARR